MILRRWTWALVPPVAVLVVDFLLATVQAAPAASADRTPPTDRAVPQAQSTENWPIDPAAAQQVLAFGPIQVVGDHYAGRGMTGARRFDLELADSSGRAVRVRAKWKPVPKRFDGVNNSPRRELAAYEVQKLFLAPEDYVVPTSALRCLSASDFVVKPEGLTPTLAGTRCVLGLLSLWLNDVGLPEAILDVERFRGEPGYARRRADFNLATYLMKHQDGRRGNILVSTIEGSARVYAIDNGVSFGGLFYNWFVPNWKKLRVPALRKASVDRLRGLSKRDLDKLGVVAQVERLPDGEVVSVPPGTNIDPDDGVRFQNGVLQLGLDEEEIDDLWERIEDLIEDVDEGDIALF